jgi:radical SAM protein with 4Fe4S-binding SPASM domain
MHETDTTAPSDTGLQFLWLELTARCNLACTHCYADSGPTPTTMDSLTVSDYQQLLSAARAGGCERVQFIGGEPTLHPGLPFLVKEARALGFTFIEVYTNATHLPDALLTCLRDHNVHIATSLYAEDPDTHDAITTRPGSHKRTVANIKRYVAAGLPVRIGIIAMQQNAQRLEETLAFAKHLGVAHASIDRQRGIGRGHEDVAVEPIGELCGACANGSLAVAPDGQVFACIMSRQWPLGSVREQQLRTFLGSPAWETFRTQLKREQVAACPPYDPCFPKSGCPPAPCSPNDCVPFAGPRCRPQEYARTVR